MLFSSRESIVPVILVLLVFGLHATKLSSEVLERDLSASQAALTEREQVDAVPASEIAFVAHEQTGTDYYYD